MLFPIKITKIISNQFTDLKFNGLPTGLPYSSGIPGVVSDFNNPMIMGCSTANSANLSITAANIPSALASKCFIGVRQAGQTTILASAMAQVAPTATALQFQAIDGSNKYEIVVGYDFNGNGILDAQEVTSVYAGSGATSPTSNQDKVIAITKTDYDTAVTSLNVITYPSGIFGAFSNARAFIQTFLNPSLTPSGATSTFFTLYSNDPDLKHPLGARWTASGNYGSANAQFFTFNNSTDFSKKVAQSVSIKNIILNQIAQQKNTVISFFNANPAATLYNSPSIAYQAPSFSFSKDDPNSDLFFTLGSVDNLNGHFSFQATKSNAGIILVDVTYDGIFTDIYNFYFFASSKVIGFETGLNKNGAIVQAGFPALGTSGQVFESKIIFSVSSGTSANFKYTFQ